MVFITGTKPVACAVQNKSLNVQINFSVSPCEVCGGQNSTSTGFFQSPSVYLSISSHQCSTLFFISMNFCQKDNWAIHGTVHLQVVKISSQTRTRALNYCVTRMILSFYKWYSSKITNRFGSLYELWGCKIVIYKRRCYLFCLRGRKRTVQPEGI